MATGTSATDSKVVTEGKAEVFLPTSVFYNPVQEFNRDLTIAVISQHVENHYAQLRKKQEKAQQSKAAKTGEDDFVIDRSPSDPKELTSTASSGPCDGEDLIEVPTEPGKVYGNGIRILEGLAASGLRSVRFAKEIAGVKEIVANDFNAGAVEYIKKNVAHNNIEGLVQPSHSDASILMYNHRKHSKKFDVIDLDPYGTPAPFLDAAVQSVRDGGLLCVTCTDVAILCGNASETCFSKYGSMSLRTKACHEMAVRIVLQSIESHANRYSRYIVPLLSLSVDFYLRMFVRLETGQRKVKDSVTKKAYFYLCSGCGAYSLVPLATSMPTSGQGNYKYTAAQAPPDLSSCEHCGFKFHIGGPLWSAPIHDSGFVGGLRRWVEGRQERFGTAQRVVGMLSVVAEELPDVPLYYVLDDLCRVMHCTAPPLLPMRSAILNAGYEVSASHACRNSLKTTAPLRVLWDILRCWVKEHPVKEDRLHGNTPAAAILRVQPQLEANFDLHPSANPQSRQDGLVRYQVNPTADWGPKARARRGEISSLDERRLAGMTKASGKRTVSQSDPNYLKQFPCKRYRRNLCNLGDDCRYSHSVHGGVAMETEGITMEIGDMATESGEVIHEDVDNGDARDNSPL